MTAKQDAVLESIADSLKILAEATQQTIADRGAMIAALERAASTNAVIADATEAVHRLSRASECMAAVQAWHHGCEGVVENGSQRVDFVVQKFFENV